MAKTAVCTLTCEHDELKIYDALGLVSVEPHFDKDNFSEELLKISEKYPFVWDMRRRCYHMYRG